MSKGSKQRPGQGYSEGFDRIFGKKEPAKQPEPQAEQPDYDKLSNSAANRNNQLE